MMGNIQKKFNDNDEHQEKKKEKRTNKNPYK